MRSRRPSDELDEEGVVGAPLTMKWIDEHPVRDAVVSLLILGATMVVAELGWVEVIGTIIIYTTVGGFLLCLLGELCSDLRGSLRSLAGIIGYVCVPVLCYVLLLGLIRGMALLVSGLVNVGARFE